MVDCKHAALACLVAFAGLAASAAEEAGVVKTRKGDVSVERSGQKIDAPVGTRIFSSDRVMTGADSSVGVGSVFRICCRQVPPRSSPRARPTTHGRARRSADCAYS